MGNKLIKIGLLSAISLAGVFITDPVKAESNFSQPGKVCKVTKRGGSSMYVASLKKDFPIRRGGTMIVVDPEPHQGIIVVKAMVNRKMTQGEIKLDDTNCVPILPK